MAKSEVFLVSGILLVLTIVGAVIWVIRAKKKLEILRVQAAAAEEQIKTAAENQQIAKSQEEIQKEQSLQKEIQLRLDEINLKIDTLKVDYSKKIDLIKKATTWEDLEIQ